MTLGGGGGRVCSNNPDHKVGMLAQRILKMPSSISLGVLELQSPNILTYLMNVSCMDDMKKVYCPLYLVVNYAPTPTSPMHGETSHLQVKDPVCSVVTLMHGGSSCGFDSLYFHLKKCNIFVGWLVGCFGFNGPLRQYFSLYRAVSQREGERGEKG